MKRALSIFYGLIFIAFMAASAGCADKNTIIDTSTSVDNHNWTYLGKFRFDVQIDDEKVPYNLYMNLRVTGDYKYSNIFVLVTQVGPDKKTAVKRYEFTLAAKDGQWLGQGSGNLYSYQLPFLNNYKFPAKGAYTFYLEQNMRDNPLRAVSDVGLRVEKATRP